MFFSNLATKLVRSINPTTSLGSSSRKLSKLAYVISHQSTLRNYFSIKTIANRTTLSTPTSTRNLFLDCTIKKLKTLECTKKLTSFVKSRQRYCIAMLAMSLFFRVERVPFSGRRHLVCKLPFLTVRMSQSCDDLEEYFGEGTIFSVNHPKTIKASLMVKEIVQAMHTTLGLKHPCTVRAGVHAPGYDNGRVWTIARPSTSNFKHTKQSSKNFSTRHLEGREWKVLVVDLGSIDYAMVQTVKGNIFISKNMIDSHTNAELACIIGHELGHAIGRQVMDEVLWMPLRVIMEFGLVLLHTLVHRKIPSRERIEMYWDLVVNFRVRWSEHESDYIGMMLMAAAGYDPKVAPIVVSRGGQDCNDILSTHPCGYKRIQYLENHERMSKALDLYKHTREREKRIMKVWIETLIDQINIQCK